MGHRARPAQAARALSTAATRVGRWQHRAHSDIKVGCWKHPAGRTKLVCSHILSVIFCSHSSRGREDMRIHHNLRVSSVLVHVDCLLCRRLGPNHGHHRGYGDRSERSVVPNVSITVTSQGTGLTRKIVTSQSGNYAVPLLPVGVYSVSAEARASRKRRPPESCWRSTRSPAWTSCWRWAR